MADTFALDVAAFAKKAGNNAKLAVRKIGIDILRGVVLATPVGNPALWKGPAPKGYVGGRLRANWAASLGSPDFTVSQTIDKTGGPTIGRGTATINGADGVQDIYIMNSLPYVREIEYEGHSQQAPAGMVRITVSQFQTFVDAAVKGLPK